jgi:hypothetical protein
MCATFVDASGPLLVGSQFLIRPRPLPGESLSSWRQRAGRENGYRLFPLQDGRLRRSDPDLGGDEEDLSWVAASHSVPEADVRSLALAGLIGTLVPSLQPRHHPAWWIPSRYGQAVAAHGTMYCPVCLRTDQTPYFRLAWRLAFNYACPHHSVRLLEKCPICRAHPWPSGCGVVERTSSRFLSLRHCWQCGGDLTTVEVQTVVQQPHCESWLRTGTANLGNVEVSAFDAFRVLRAMCGLFIRAATRAQIASGTSAYAKLTNALEDVDGESRRIESLSVRHREVIVPAALDLLHDWPHRFLAMANDSGIARVHFNGTYHLTPPWFNRFVDDELARQNRWVTSDDVLNVVRVLRQAGERPTKTKIRRELQWQGDIDDELLE